MPEENDLVQTIMVGNREQMLQLLRRIEGEVERNFEDAFAMRMENRFIEMLGRLQEANFIYTSSIEEINGTHIWKVRATTENQKFNNNSGPFNVLPANVAQLSEDKTEFTVRLTSEEDINNAILFLRQCHGQVEHEEAMYSQLELLREAFRAPLVEPLIPTYSILNDLSLMLNMVIDYASSFIQPAATAAPLLTTAPSSISTKIRMTNQQRLEAIEKHEEFNAWDGKEEFITKTNNWRDPLSQDLFEDPLSVKPSLSRSSYNISMLTTKIHPESREALPDDVTSDTKLKTEIEQTLSDAENALRRLSTLEISQTPVFDFRNI